MAPIILTHSGINFNLLNPDLDLIDIEDIAHALAHLCRFTGHSKHFYSVAHHSILVSSLVPAEHRLEALLHDAAEAYIGDVSSPLKAQLPGYREIEHRIEAAIRQRFGLPAELSPYVKAADLQMLAAEKAQVMPPCTEPWGLLESVTVPNVTISHNFEAYADIVFLQKFREYSGTDHLAGMN